MYVIPSISVPHNVDHFVHGSLQNKPTLRYIVFWHDCLKAWSRCLPRQTCIIKFEPLLKSQQFKLVLLSRKFPGNYRPPKTFQTHRQNATKEGFVVHN